MPRHRRTALDKVAQDHAQGRAYLYGCVPEKGRAKTYKENCQYFLWLHGFNFKCGYFNFQSAYLSDCKGKSCSHYRVRLVGEVPKCPKCGRFLKGVWHYSGDYHCDNCGMHYDRETLK